MKLEHFACLAAGRALGLMDASNEVVSGSRHAKMGVYRDLCVSRAIAKGMVNCAHQCYGVEIAPLHMYTDYEPDIVILVTTPYNAMRVVQAYAYYNGHLTNVKLSGMQAICQECTSYPYEKNQINLSMLCSGTRCVAQWGKEELGIGIPVNKLDSLIDGLKKTMNHMDQNKDKKQIKEKLEANNLEQELEIVFNRNYYTGAYGTIEQLKRKSKA